MQLMRSNLFRDDRNMEYEYQHHSSVLFMKRGIREFAIVAAGLGIIVSLGFILLPVEAIKYYAETHSVQTAGVVRFVVSSILMTFGMPVYLLFISILEKRAITKNKTLHLSCSKCPACFSDMRGRPVEEDGCVVCPKCGAAWKLTDRVSQP